MQATLQLNGRGRRTVQALGQAFRLIKPPETEYLCTEYGYRWLNVHVKQRDAHAGQLTDKLNQTSRIPGFVTISQLYFTYFGEYPVCDRQGINNPSQSAMIFGVCMFWGLS